MSIHQRDNNKIIKSNFITSCLIFRGLILTIFSFQVVIDIIRNDEDPELETMEECHHRKYWPKWKEYILTKFDLMKK